MNMHKVLLFQVLIISELFHSINDTKTLLKHQNKNGMSLITFKVMFEDFINCNIIKYVISLARHLLDRFYLIFLNENLNV